MKKRFTDEQIIGHPARGRGRRHVDQGPVQEAQPDREQMLVIDGMKEIVRKK